MTQNEGATPLKNNQPTQKNNHDTQNSKRDITK